MTAQATRQLTTRKTWSASWSPDKMRATSTVWLPPTNPKFYSTTGKDGWCAAGSRFVVSLLNSLPKDGNLRWGSSDQRWSAETWR